MKIELGGFILWQKTTMRLRSKLLQRPGDVNISNDVVSIVASLAASSVKGVSGMVSSISGGIAELLGQKEYVKGRKG